VHAVENRLHGFVGGALAVGVLDAQDEFAAAMTRLQPAVQRGARAADVQIAGGTGSERVRTVMRKTSAEKARSLIEGRVATRAGDRDAPAKPRDERPLANGPPPAARHDAPNAAATIRA
jgi:hypothetical protein